MERTEYRGEDGPIWPTKKHTLHAPPTSYWTFSDIGWQRHQGMYGRVSGFRRAAEILYRSMITERSIADLDTVFFPYATCWRHCVELQLKSLLASLRALAGDPPTGEPTHKISGLWQEVAALIETHLSDDGDLANVGRVIAQLTSLDPDSQAFRYATDRRGQPTLATLDKVNLVKFHEALTAVSNYLDAAGDAASETLSVKREMDAYYAAEFGDTWSSDPPNLDDF